MSIRLFVEGMVDNEKSRKVTLRLSRDTAVTLLFQKCYARRDSSTPMEASRVRCPSRKVLRMNT